MTEPFRLLDIPPIDSSDDRQHGWKYEALHRLITADQMATHGRADEIPSVRKLIATRANQVYQKQHWVLAVQGPEVGWASVILPIAEDRDKAQLGVCVDPARRRQGIGSALLAWGEDLIAKSGRTLVFAEITYGAGDDHEPYMETSQAAKVPLMSESVSFPLKRGYEVTHAQRRSVLDVPMDPRLFAQLMADTARYRSGYRLHTWFCEIPRQWKDSFAQLKEDFCRDAPQGTIPLDHQTWNHERINQMVRETLDAGNVFLMTAVEHEATGELVGFTELRWPAEPDEAAEQWFTIVSGKHRGHRLGMWVKLANAAELVGRCPGIRRIHTDNAQENAHMLGINIAMGFRPDGGIALMAKRL